MQSIQTKIQQLKDQVRPQVQLDIGKVVEALAQLNKSSKKQVDANQTLIKNAMNSIVPNLVEGASIQVSKTSPSDAVALQKQLNLFKDKFSDFIKPTWKKQINSLIQITKTKAQRLKQMVLQKNGQNKMKGDFLQKNINKNQAIKQLNVQAPQQQYKKYDIQFQIQPIQQIIVQPVTSIGIQQQQLPQSVKFLNKYAMKQGYMGIGSTTQRSGRAYLGRYAVKQGQNQLIFPYPKNQVTTGNTPNIINNFKYYANKTINSWNKFVQDQNKLVQYTKKIATKQLRKQFVQTTIASLNYNTFCAQALATLTYYYVTIPMQIMLKYKTIQQQMSQQLFFQQYAVGDSINRNPFLLDSNGGKLIARLLFVTANPQKLYQKISAELQKLQNPVNRSRIKKFIDYKSLKTSESLAYLYGIGLTNDKALQVLKSPTMGAIKQKKFSFPSPLMNTQIVQIVQSVLKTDKQKKNTQWRLTWGNQRIMCHDYVWNYSI